LPTIAGVLFTGKNKFLIDKETKSLSPVLNRQYFRILYVVY